MMAVKAYERGGPAEVQRVINLLKTVTSTPEEKLDEKVKKDREILFTHARRILIILPPHLIRTYGWCTKKRGPL